MPAKIEPGPSFKDNLAQLSPIDGVARIDLINGKGDVAASIANEPGKQGSLAVYLYLEQVFGPIDAAAAQHGLQIFGEHTADARGRPGAHPNIDRLLAIASGAGALRVEVFPA